MSGFIVGGVLTNNDKATYSFLILTVSEFLVTMIACFLDSSHENDQKDQMEMPICLRIKEIFKQIRECVRERTLFRMFIFQIAYGASIPRFDDYMFQYYTSPDQAGFSQL